MTNRALTVLSLPAMAAALLVAAPAAAQTECQPDDIFCAELRFGGAGGAVRIGPAPAPVPPPVLIEPAPPPPPALVQPQPPVVILQPDYAQPPPPPPPQAVYVRPAPPPPMYVQRYQPPPRVRQDRYSYSSTGINLHVDAAAGDNMGMLGGGAGFRLRPMPHIGVDLGASIFGGSDYNGLDRIELPITADVLFFFNPYNRFQFYALVGVGGSFSHASGENRFTLESVDRDYGHLGGSAGLGMEWRIGRGFALNLDVRAFLRYRVDGNDTPEFTEFREGEWQSTDLSAGFLGRVGMTFYFGG